jgi:hypothetical protein
MLGNGIYVSTIIASLMGFNGLLHVRRIVTLFWKSALIMASRYPRERDEVDRKKRRAADTIHFLFP